MKSVVVVLFKSNCQWIRAAITSNIETIVIQGLCPRNDINFQSEENVIIAIKLESGQFNCLIFPWMNCIGTVHTF